MKFLAPSLNMAHEQVSTNRWMSSILEVSELTRPLGSLASLLKNDWNYLPSKRSKLIPTANALVSSSHPPCTGLGEADDWAPEAELVVFCWFCKPRANPLVLNSSSVLHMQRIEIIMLLHKSLLVVILLPNDLCILIINFLCYACNFPWVGTKLHHRNDLWNGNLFESSY